MSANKALIALVIGMGVIILVGLAVLGYGLVQRAADPSLRFFARPASPTLATLPSGPDLTIPISPGSSIASVEARGELLMVHVVDEEDRSTLLFIDPTDGRIVKRIAFSPRR